MRRISKGCTHRPIIPCSFEPGKDRPNHQTTASEAILISNQTRRKYYWNCEVKLLANDLNVDKLLAASFSD